MVTAGSRRGNASVSPFVWPARAGARGGPAAWGLARVTIRGLRVCWPTAFRRMEQAVTGRLFAVTCAHRLGNMDEEQPDQREQEEATDEPGGSAHDAAPAPSWSLTQDAWVELARQNLAAFKPTVVEMAIQAGGALQPPAIEGPNPRVRTAHLASPPFGARLPKLGVF
jgi:hypothetical protein